MVGAEYRHGREAREEYGESLGQPVADTHTMGLSILLAARETDQPVPFTPPPFANVYPDDSCFEGDVGQSVHAEIRDHKVATSGTNLWWVELGGEGDSTFTMLTVSGRSCLPVFTVCGITLKIAVTTAWKTGIWSGLAFCPVSENPADT